MRLAQLKITPRAPQNSPVAAPLADAFSAEMTPRVAPLKIGPVVVDPPVLQAPMAGFTNYAYRQIVRDFGGAGLQTTEMVHARGFLCLVRWPCKFGITTRQHWPKWVPSWRTKWALAWSISTLAAQSNK
jgi:hypothetical protein